MTSAENTPDEKLLSHKLNQETGKISWSDLQRQFAKGVVVVVSKDIDLVEIAEKFTKDQQNAIQLHLDSKTIHIANDNDATRWNKINQSFWAIVIAPWVLVQEI